MRNDNDVDTLGHAHRQSADVPGSPWWRRSPWRPDVATGSLSRTTRRRIAAVALALVGLLPAAEAAFGDSAARVAQPAAAVAASADSRTDQAASRSQERVEAPAAPPVQAQVVAPPVAAPAPPAAPVQVAPVAGLNQTQMDNARAIIAAGQKAGLPKRAYIIAIATAMQESRLLNLANPHHPESLRLPNQGVGYDFDSLGLFQQRPASGWGAPAQIMNAEYAANKFYAALLRVSGWDQMPLTVAAQTVQGSAFPDAYADDEPRARAVVDAVAP
jgi:hypothetical protein